MLTMMRYDGNFSSIVCLFVLSLLMLRSNVVAIGHSEFSSS